MVLARLSYPCGPMLFNSLPGIALLAPSPTSEMRMNEILPLVYSAMDDTSELIQAV
jgi:hypothetical protein